MHVLQDLQSTISSAQHQRTSATIFFEVDQRSLQSLTCNNQFQKTRTCDHICLRFIICLCTFFYNLMHIVNDLPISCCLVTVMRCKNLAILNDLFNFFLNNQNSTHTNRVYTLKFKKPKTSHKFSIQSFVFQDMEFAKS